MNEALWKGGRSGSHAGHGFRYQDAVATELALRAWAGELALGRLVPEGVDDVSLERGEGWLHMQVKSRRAHRGSFSAGELGDAWRHLAERLVADPTSYAALVLERPLVDVDSGLERTLADVATPALRTAIATAVGDVIDVDAFVSRTHLVVMPATVTTAVALLADKLGLPAASCIAHHAVLRAELGRLADENGIRPFDDMAALSVGDIGRLISDLNEGIDPSLLDEAERTGLAELVDFATPVADKRFYGGVDVVVGHIVAGLPLARPELTEALVRGLDRQVGLVVGASGSGKSALLWLTAYETRHCVRWYRVRRLRDEDVPALVRLVKGARPDTMPVGFVVDDVGRGDRGGFDRLVTELRDYPHALVLGACREEDLFVVETAMAAAQVRPELEEPLAERLFAELRVREQTSWPEWREPYELSEQLLLEYGHLLTEGTRLGETIAAQVQRRVREQRALELDVLALVATADAFGAELDPRRLATALAVDDTQMTAALARLVAEHLVRERDGRLGGLHELRSRYASDEIHRLPPRTLAETVRRVIGLLEAPALETFLTRLLLEDAVPDNVALDAVVARLGACPDAAVLAAALQALRLVGFARYAREWEEILVDEGVPFGNVELVAHFALHGGEHDLFPQPVQRAVARIQALASVELRT